MKQVKWTYRGVTRTGNLVGVVLKGEDSWAVLPNEAKNNHGVILSRVHFDMFNERYHRAVIAVRRKSGHGHDYYAPNIKHVELA